MWESYTPKMLRDQIEFEMQKCDDPVQASYNAIAKLNKAAAENESKKTAVQILRETL